MCCFSRPVKLVADTTIFARGSKEGRQYLAYSMKLSAGEDLAMILPIPVPKGTKENAVVWINLEKYPDFFKDLRAGFPPPPVFKGRLGRGEDVGAAKLDVVEVGSFEASFVPAVKDFERLDERFRLPASTWDKLPRYQEYGFAVFKLKQGEKKIHPMAFEFPRADARKLFFPTVHIHDGKVHETAGFDHQLFCQQAKDEELDLMMHWKESAQLAGQFMKADKTQGLVDPEAHCYLREMRGRLKNEDIVV